MTSRMSQETYTKIYWVFTTFMLLSAMPLGIVLILVKLFERRRKGKAKKVFHPVAGAPLGAQTCQNATLRPLSVELEEATKKMRSRCVIGLVLVAVSFGLLFFCSNNGINLWLSGWCLFCSMFYTITGLQTLKSISRFQNYVSIMGSRPAISVEELSQKVGRKDKEIRSALKQLAFMELIPNAFLDEKRDILFCF